MGRAEHFRCLYPIARNGHRRDQVRGLVTMIRVRKNSARKLVARRTQAGFTMIELMIVILVISILMAIAAPLYTKSVIRAKEAVLKQDLFTLREQIDNYTLDKEKAPQSLEDLVTAG